MVLGPPSAAVPATGERGMSEELDCVLFPVHVEFFHASAEEKT
jgi:hypothetical protein